LIKNSKQTKRKRVRPDSQAKFVVFWDIEIRRTELNRMSTNRSKVRSTLNESKKEKSKKYEINLILLQQRHMAQRKTRNANQREKRKNDYSIVAGTLREKA